MLNILVTMVEAVTELVKREKVEIVLGRVVKPPVPRLATVDASAAFRSVVDTKFSKFGVETKFKRFGVEMKPALPIPVIVD